MTCQPDSSLSSILSASHYLSFWVNTWTDTAFHNPPGVQAGAESALRLRICSCIETPRHMCIQSRQVLPRTGGRGSKLANCLISFLMALSIYRIVKMSKIKEAQNKLGQQILLSFDTFNFKDPELERLNVLNAWVTSNHICLVFPNMLFKSWDKWHRMFIKMIWSEQNSTDDDVRKRDGHMKQGESHEAHSHISMLNFSNSGKIILSMPVSSFQYQIELLHRL